MKVPISKIRIGERFRKETGDCHSLAKSIETVGLHPVVIDEHFNLMEKGGFRRLDFLAGQKLKRPRLP